MHVKWSFVDSTFSLFNNHVWACPSVQYSSSFSSKLGQHHPIGTCFNPPCSSTFLSLVLTPFPSISFWDLILSHFRVIWNNFRREKTTKNDCLRNKNQNMSRRVYTTQFIFFREPTCCFKVLGRLILFLLDFDPYMF